MGAQQILNKIQKSDSIFQIGDEQIVVEIKDSNIKKGKSFKEMVSELKKASKENLLDINKHVCFQ
jgi:hypothetical protein